MNKKNLILRILSSLVMAPIVVLAVYFGDLYLFILISIVSILAINEVNGFAKKRDNYLHTIVLIIVNLFTLYSFFIQNEQFIIISIISYFLIISSLILFTKKKAVFERLSYHLFALFYITVSLGTLLYIREAFHIKYNLIYLDGAYFILILLITIWLSDIFAYFGGSFFGKHKLYESVSPNKTIEGSVIGFLISVSISTIIFQFFFPSFSLIFILAITIVAAIATQIGDLFESKLKRDLSIKDSGDIIPGHGGILDRIDSILFVFPVVFIYLEILSFFP